MVGTEFPSLKQQNRMLLLTLINKIEMYLKRFEGHQKVRNDMTPVHFRKFTRIIDINEFNSLIRYLVVVNVVKMPKIKHVCGLKFFTITF